MNSADLFSQSTTTATGTVKLLVFSIGNLNTALSIDMVNKVVNYSNITSSGLNYYGLVNIEGQDITVIDLHKKLFGTSEQLNPEDKKYLLLSRNSNGETFGILIKNSPELYDIALNSIRQLPNSYRRADTLKIASHVFMVATDEENQEQNQEQRTVFILDPDELILNS